MFVYVLLPYLPLTCSQRPCGLWWTMVTSICNSPHFMALHPGSEGKVLKMPCSPSWIYLAATSSFLLLNDRKSHLIRNIDEDGQRRWRGQHVLCLVCSWQAPWVEGYSSQWGAQEHISSTFYEQKDGSASKTSVQHKQITPSVLKWGREDQLTNHKMDVEMWVRYVFICGQCMAVE